MSLVMVAEGISKVQIFVLMVIYQKKKNLPIYLWYVDLGKQKLKWF